MFVNELLANCFVGSHGLVIFADYSFVVRKVNLRVIYNFGRSNNFVNKVVPVYKATTYIRFPRGISSGARVVSYKSRVSSHCYI